MKLSILSTLLFSLSVLASPLAAPAPSQEEGSVLDAAQSGTCNIKDPWRGQAVICSRYPTPKGDIVYKFTGRSIPVECYTPATRGGSTGPLSSVYFRVTSPNGPCYIADADMDASSLCKVRIGSVVC